MARVVVVPGSAGHLRSAPLAGTGIRAGVVNGVIHVVQWPADGIGKTFASQFTMHIVAGIPDIADQESRLIASQSGQNDTTGDDVHSFHYFSLPIQ
jgi:hypothetical protein